MQLKTEPGLTRSKSRETSRVVRRPEHGEVRETVKCRHCGREGVFVIQDLETTRRLRKGPVIRSLIASAVLLGSTVSLWVVGLSGDNPDEKPLYLILAIVASLLFAPIGLYLAFDPSGKIGVESPEMIHFEGETRREGLTIISGSGYHRDKGLACSGRAKAA
ncbi:hypothetical protein [Streptomyces sp. NPDC058653]|uniref:hypothetical protein n=1 Tax=Streptomyces sp. NPDC058653 TaxID=3346576 RepID=UPI00365534D5